MIILNSINLKNNNSAGWNSYLWPNNLIITIWFPFPQEITRKHLLVNHKVRINFQNNTLERLINQVSNTWINLASTRWITGSILFSTKSSFNGFWVINHLDCLINDFKGLAIILIDHAIFWGLHYFDWSINLFLSLDLVTYFSCIICRLVTQCSCLDRGFVSRLANTNIPPLTRHQIAPGLKQTVFPRVIRVEWYNLKWTWFSVSDLHFLYIRTLYIYTHTRRLCLPQIDITQRKVRLEDLFNLENNQRHSDGKYSLNRGHLGTTPNYIHRESTGFTIKLWLVQ